MGFHFVQLPLTLDDLERSNSKKKVSMVCIFKKRLLKATGMLSCHNLAIRGNYGPSTDGLV